MNIDIQKSVAVLPFVNRSSSQDAEYFSDGITEEIINALAKIKGLRVTSRTSSFSFKGKEISLSEIANQLNVSIIIEGSVRLAGTSARISVQLIEAVNDSPFWTETFDRNLENVFAVQDEISLIIADRLRENLGHFDLNDHLVDFFDIPFLSYKKYLKGRFYLMKLDYESTLKAISIFEEVIEESPDFPLSYLDINKAYIYMGTMGIISAFESYTKAQPFLQKAIELDEELPETQLNLAWASFYQKLDMDKAYVYLNNALRIRPTDEMYITMANFLTFEGKLDSAMKYTDKALELAPFSPVAVSYKGFVSYMMGQYGKALPYFQQALALQPDLPFPLFYIGCSHLLMGRYQRGLDYFNSLPDDSNGYLTKLGGISVSHAVMGNTEGAMEGITQLETYLESESASNALLYMITCYTQLNKLEIALDYIGKAVENRFPYVFLLSIDPMVAPLQKLPAFTDLMKTIVPKTKATISTTNLKKSIFSTKELKAYKQRLTDLMEEDELYLNPDLSLRSLSEYMNMTPNNLSKLLNEGLEQNFANYVNSYRLDYFKQRLEDESAHELTILALAYESGFNSKTVFNTFFKKKLGVTPKVYWKKLKNKF